MGNRLCAQFKSKLGVRPSQKEDDAEADAKEVINALKESYKKLTDGVVKHRDIPQKDKFKGNELISTYTEAQLVVYYLRLEAQEAAQFRQLESALADVPIYPAFLEKVRGCGPAMAGVLVSELDPYKARHVSSFWKYAGLDVAPAHYRLKDGKVDPERPAAYMKGRSRVADHLVERTYKDKEGAEKTRMGITFNPFLKTKLFVLATCFIKSGSEYRKFYDNYSNRLANHVTWKDRPKAHRHNAAMRYMLKMFLQDLWLFWRGLEGLEVTRPYQEAYLGHVHGQDGSNSTVITQ